MKPHTLAEATAAANSVVETARRRGVRFVVAESCTGGLIGHLVTEVPGSSAAFAGGWVAYADVRKVEDLGVADAQIARHGAVSQPVVETMAQGARRRAKVDYAVATTGIAGPGGGSREKPLGLVWIAVAGPTGVSAVAHVSEAAERSTRKIDFAAHALRRLLDAMDAQPTSGPHQ